MTRGALVVLSLEPWDEIWRRNQYLVDGLLRGDETLRVLFAEPAADVGHALRTRRSVVRGRGLRTHPGYGGRLSLLQPTKTLPRALGPFADLSLARQLDTALRETGMVDPVVWVNDASWAPWVRRAAHPTLYDVTDDWTAADRAPRERRRLLRNEDVLRRRAREVIVCSPGLRASWGATRAVRLIPNAVDLSRYRRPVPRPADLPDGPVALYAGTLHEDRLDVDLILRTAERAGAAGGTVVAVGPVALAGPHAAALRDRGVLLLGPRPYDAVPGYLQHADVLIVPHAVTAFTESLDPIKLYEYRAAGRPVVSTPVAGFREAAGEGTEIVPAEAFPDAVARALRPRAETRLLAVPDWSDRVAAMREVVDALRRA